MTYLNRHMNRRQNYQPGSLPPDHVTHLNVTYFTVRDKNATAE